MVLRTLTDIFYYSVDTFRKPAHLRFKRNGAWHDISSDDLRTAVEELSMGLRALGVAPGDKVGILSENRPEWAMADLASLVTAAIDVPIYSTLTPSQILYILNDSETKVLFVSNAVQARKVAEVRSQAKFLQHVVRFDDEPIADTMALADLRAQGRPALKDAPGAVRERAAANQPGDVATFIYTSGTTGDPKGVMLTHDNITSNVLASEQVFSDLGAEHVALSFLPLCHIFERMAGHYLMLKAGVSIAYAESIEKVPDNMAEVQPSVMCSVPRLYEKMYARINEKVASDPALRQRIFRWAVGVGREFFGCRVLKTTPGLGLRLRFALADKLVFSKIKARTGGKLELFVSGGAPLSREIAEFFGAAGLLILEGYGLTETSPVICVNRPHDIKPGSVGKPLEGVEVRIAEDGEILTRGRHVMKGYFKKPEATAEAIDGDGWFHTGDVGVIDTEGFLTITDRKKDILVTSGGKNIAPQPIESRIKNNGLFTEVCMIGNKRNFPAALIIPNFDNLEKWARQKGLGYGSRLELVAHPEVNALYERTLEDIAREAGWAQFEKIKKFTLLPKEFSIEGGELTPKLSVKRRFVEQKYKDLIDELYAGSAAA
jgi:long-chain acyl-CoA synthetase